MVFWMHKNGEKIMMTKKQFCETIIQQFKREYNLMTNDAVANHYPDSDSRLSVALDSLGMLEDHPMGKLVAARNDGILFVHVNELTGVTSTLTVKDMVELLPDALD